MGDNFRDLMHFERVVDDNGKGIKIIEELLQNIPPEKREEVVRLAIEMIKRKEHLR